MADPSELVILPRSELAKLFPTARVRAAFESLFLHVQGAIPDDIQQLQEYVGELQGLEVATRATAAQALALVVRALQGIEEGPPPAVPLPAVADDAGPPAAAMIPPPPAPDDAGPTMLGLLERVAALENAVAQLSQGPTPL